jgi:DNA-binding CsgD family transcriptional regulator
VLSAREQEIVELVARGLSNREIAATACISRNTVKAHLKRIFAKVGIASRAELAAAAARAEGGADEPVQRAV